MAVSREKLYGELWAEPMTTVAKRYDVPSNYLARICGQLHFPRASRGYWAQLKWDEPQKQPSLPAVRPGDDVEWVRDGDHPRAAAVRPVRGTPHGRKAQKLQPRDR